MRRVYRSDALIKLSWYQGSAEGFIESSMRMASGKTSSSHRLQPIVVRVNRSKAVATLSATIDSRVVVDEVEVDLESHTRLIYRALKANDDGRWKLASLDCIYQRDRLDAAIPGEGLATDTKAMKSYCSTYRCLSYILEKRGYPVDSDLPGDDRPEQVKRLYDESFAWLNSREILPVPKRVDSQ